MVPVWYHGHFAILMFSSMYWGHLPCSKRLRSYICLFFKWGLPLFFFELRWSSVCQKNEVVFQLKSVQSSKNMGLFSILILPAPIIKLRKEVVFHLEKRRSSSIQKQFRLSFNLRLPPRTNLHIAYLNHQIELLLYSKGWPAGWLGTVILRLSQSS